MEVHQGEEETAGTIKARGIKGSNRTRVARQALLKQTPVCYDKQHMFDIWILYSSLI